MSTSSWIVRCEAPPEQRRALNDLTACRTAALGGHVWGVPSAGISRWPTTRAATATARSVRPRLPRMAGGARSRSAARGVLPSRLHAPGGSRPDRLANPRVVYDLLLRSAAETLLQVAANPEHLGAQIGVLAVLHTWGQNLQHHPHVHCVVPGGGLSSDGSRWVAWRPRFFLPVRVLSRVFRGKFLAGLRTAFAAGRLHFAGPPTDRRRPMRASATRLGRSARTDWVVYAKTPIRGFFIMHTSNIFGKHESLLVPIG